MMRLRHLQDVTSMAMISIEVHLAADLQLLLHLFTNITFHSGVSRQLEEAWANIGAMSTSL